jgi:hypothetical protein
MPIEKEGVDDLVLLFLIGIGLTSFSLTPTVLIDSGMPSSLHIIGCDADGNAMVHGVQFWRPKVEVTCPNIGITVDGSGFHQHPPWSGREQPEQPDLLGI